MRLLRWLIHLFKKEQRIAPKGYGYHISDAIWNSKWGGKYNDIC